MGRLNIYEIIFYGDSSKKKPFICEINNELECRKFHLGMSYKKEEELEIKIIQHGLKDNFIKNTQKLLIIDKKVKKIMDEERLEDIEYVPVKIEEQEYYVLNIINLIYGSLNMSKSIVLTFPDDFPNERVRGEIGSIWKTVLYKNKIQGHIFRIAEYASDIFVDEYFKNIIEKNGFTGIDFHAIELS